MRIFNGKNCVADFYAQKEIPFMKTATNFHQATNKQIFQLKLISLLDQSNQYIVDQHYELLRIYVNYY